MNLFDQINHVIRDSESSLVNLLSAIAPWLAPLAPAYLTFSHLTAEEFGFPIWVAISVAMVVEVLGLSAVSTILAFWAHNRRYKDEKKRAPVWIAVFSFVIYLMIILVINVVLDAALTNGSTLSYDWMVVGAKALLTLLSVPAAIILAVRTQHKEVLDAIDDEREQRRAMRHQKPASTHRASNDNGRVRERLYSQGKARFLDDLRTGKLQAYLQENNLELTPKTISELYGTVVRNAYRWLEEAREMGLLV